MRAQPPAKLVDLLGRLNLATPKQIAAVGPRAVRLAGELPDFESVWVDALAQQRIVSPLQAAEINAGRGEGLLFGPYRIHDRLTGPNYAQCFAAEHIHTRRAVRLYTARTTQRSLADALAKLQELQTKSAEQYAGPAVLEDFGSKDGSIWAVYSADSGRPIHHWLVEHGRMAPQAVLQIARQMVAALRQLEDCGQLHGDISANNLLVDARGSANLAASGLRCVVRPEEGYSFCDLSPEAYDYLAPERVSDGTPPNTASDIYACGCLWWQLLAGRPPRPGGNAIAKLRAVHASRIADIRQFSPTISDTLHSAMDACLKINPQQRPQSFRELADSLGEPTPAGQALVATVFRVPRGSWSNLRPSRRRRQSQKKHTVAAVGAAAAALFAVGLAPLILRSQADSSPSRTVATSVVERPAKPEPLVEPVAPQPIQVDAHVRPATATVPVVDTVIEDLVLATDAPVRLNLLELKSHIRVRGRGGNRARVLVPTDGLEVRHEDVHFENIDFVGDWSASNATKSFIELRGQTISFHGCAFSSRNDNPPTAIRFAGSGEPLPGLGGEIGFTNCVFDGLAAIVDDVALGSLSVNLNNVLCVAAGPILRLARPPRPEDQVRLNLDHITTRGDTAVLHYRYGQLSDAAGTVTIAANSSAFAGGGRAGLIIFSGSTRPEALVTTVNWIGQGSIVVPQTPVLVWHTQQRRLEALPDDDFEVAGLVRGEIEFAGRSDGPAENSRIVRWQVPLRSPDPPGADPVKLASPRD